MTGEQELLDSYPSQRFRPSSPLGQLLVARRAEIVALARVHHATHVRVFGSVARGEDDPASDIDLLVDLEPSADKATTSAQAGESAPLPVFDSGHRLTVDDMDEMISERAQERAARR